MLAHALEEFPKESCGIIIDGEYIPCENKAEDPTKDFLIDSDYVNLLISQGQVEAIIHSHPFDKILKKSSPSKSDMQGQISSGIPWGIIDTDGEIANNPYWLSDANLDTPLLGMEFHHGVFDCYTAIRKWYWQRKGIKLTDIPRDDLWWNNGENLYVDNFQSTGWVKIHPKEIKDGDVILGKLLSPVLNHAGVYLNNKEDGKGLVYHHLPNRLSRREPITPWLNRAEMVLRYVK